MLESRAASSLTTAWTMLMPFSFYRERAFALALFENKASFLEGVMLHTEKVTNHPRFFTLWAGWK